MGNDPIQEILEKRKKQEAQPNEREECQFYSILLVDSQQEYFFEVRFKSGQRTCFAWDDLTWFNFFPEDGTIDLEFGGYQVTLTGRGLGERLFEGIKQRRVAWVQEALTEWQDNDKNEAFIKSIDITGIDMEGSGVNEETEEQSG